MKASNRIAPVCFALTGLLVLACGRQNDERATTSDSALASDSVESQAAVSSGFNETMDSMSDTNVARPSSSALRLTGNIGASILFDVDRTCESPEDKAIVTIDINKEAKWDRSNARVSVAATATVKNNLVRTWSKDGGSVDCNGKFAAIDFEADLTGYTLDVAVDRTAERSLERTVIKTGETSKVSLKTSVQGSRHVVWTSQEAQADGGISRNKTISFQVDRSDSFVAKDGTVKDLSLSVATTEDLQVTVVWDSLTKDRQLLSKQINSGKVKGSHAGGGSMEASFSNLLMKFTASSCAVYSGSMEAKVYAEGSATASRIYLLTATAGTITVQDVTDPANPLAVDDFDYSPCEIKDFNE